MKRDTFIEDIKGCETKSCLVEKGATLVRSEKDETGRLVETYRFERDSIAMAATRGCLGFVRSSFIEAPGTTHEAKRKKRPVTIKVYLDQDENIKRIEQVQ